jgi:ribosomal protein S5
MFRNLMKVNSSLVSTLLRPCEQRAVLSCVCSTPEHRQQRTQVRWYASSIGQYDRLWQSVNSGKGIKVSRRTYPKGFPGWGFGSKGMNIPGLNAPLDTTPASQVKKWKEETGPPRIMQNRELKWTTKKGWSGKGFEGRGLGCPVTEEGVEMKDFDSCVIQLKRIRRMRRTGKDFTCTALVIVGNRKGALGWAIGRGKNYLTAMRKGRNKALYYLHEIPVCDEHTIYHEVKSKVNQTRIQMERRVDGHGLRCQRIVKSMADLAGIKDLRAKLSGGKNPITVVQVTMQALLCQETHQELANRTGKYVLEHHAGVERPLVVAYPTPEAVELNGKEMYDPMAVLKPHLYQHAQKDLDSVKAKNPDLMKNTYENVA